MGSPQIRVIGASALVPTLGTCEVSCIEAVVLRQRILAMAVACSRFNAQTAVLACVTTAVWAGNCALGTMPRFKFLLSPVR